MARTSFRLKSYQQASCRGELMVSFVSELSSWVISGNLDENRFHKHNIRRTGSPYVIFSLCYLGFTHALFTCTGSPMFGSLFISDWRLVYPVLHESDTLCSKNRTQLCSASAPSFIPEHFSAKST